MSRKGILGICNPIIDSFAFVKDSFLIENNLEKGGNIILPNDKIKEIKNKIKLDSDECGGSGMNVTRWLGILGYRVGVLGQYADDARGELIKNALKDCNVENKCIVKKGGITTNLCIFVTPDAQRTMMGIFGVSHEEYAEPIDFSILDEFEGLLLTGYQYSNKHLVPVANEFVKRAKSLGIKVIMVVSSVFNVPGYKENLLKEIENIDIITGTEEEFSKLFDISNLEDLLKHLEVSKFELCALTMGEKGFYLIKEGKRHYYPGSEVDNVIDTTGAGDSLTAGLLYGYFNNLSIEKTAQLARSLAGYTIRRIGVPVNSHIKSLAQSWLED